MTGNEDEYLFDDGDVCERTESEVDPPNRREFSREILVSPDFLDSMLRDAKQHFIGIRNKHSYGPRFDTLILHNQTSRLDWQTLEPFQNAAMRA